jgi:hypothetical protein
VERAQQQQRLLASRFPADTCLLRKGYKAWTLVFKGQPETLWHDRAVELSIVFEIKDGVEVSVPGAGG